MTITADLTGPAVALTGERIMKPTNSAEQATWGWLAASCLAGRIEKDPEKAAEAGRLADQLLSGHVEIPEDKAIEIYAFICEQWPPIVSFALHKIFWPNGYGSKAIVYNQITD